MLKDIKSKLSVEAGNELFSFSFYDFFAIQTLLSKRLQKIKFTTMQFGTLWRTYLSFTVPRILVVTGFGRWGGTKKTELWPKPESQCHLPDYPLGVSDAVGFWTAHGPTVCGGIGGGKGRRLNKCFIYKEHQWMPWTNMGTARARASAIQIDSNQALIIGGYDENQTDLKTTELISSSGSEEGKDFPVTIFEHCSFKVNATHVIVTGGVQDWSRSTSTWFVDLTTTTVTPGPNMKTKRSNHGCSMFKQGTKSFGIVSGGWKSGGKLDSTEMIDLDQESPTWTEGMQDKSKIQK